MNLNNPFPYNSSYKIHILIGIILGALLGFVLIVLQPFNLNNFNHDYGEVLLLGFGFVKFLNYLLAHFTENHYYKNKGNWTLWNEIIFLLLSSVSGTILGYIYLDAVFEKQPLTFLRLILFFYYIVLPVLPLLIFPQTVLRYLLVKKLSKRSEGKTSENEKIAIHQLILKGQNARDKLSLLEEHLLYVKSMDNYVQVYYKDPQFKSKILRAKLSEILTQAPFLIQPHRSYLVNPRHSFKVKGNSQKAVLILNQIEEAIPISRSSFKTVKDLFN